MLAIFKPIGSLKRSKAVQQSFQRTRKTLGFQSSLGPPVVHSLLTCAPSSFEQVQCRATRSPNPAAPAQTTVLVLRWAAGEHQSRETDDCGAVQNVLHHLARDVLVVLFLSLSFQLCFFYSWVLDSSCSKVTVITFIMHHVNHRSHSKHSILNNSESWKWLSS